MVRCGSIVTGVAAPPWLQQTPTHPQSTPVSSVPSTVYPVPVPVREHRNLPDRHVKPKSDSWDSLGSLTRRVPRAPRGAASAGAVCVRAVRTAAAPAVVDRPDRLAAPSTPSRVPTSRADHAGGGGGGVGGRAPGCCVHQRQQLPSPARRRCVAVCAGRCTHSRGPCGVALPHQRPATPETRRRLGLAERGLHVPKQLLPCRPTQSCACCVWLRLHCRTLRGGGTQRHSEQLGYLRVVDRLRASSCERVDCCIV